MECPLETAGRGGLLSSFPHLVKKGLGLELYHVDDLAGKVTIESDGDLVGALKHFMVEMQQISLRKEYLVLHGNDTIPPLSPVIQ